MPLIDLSIVRRPALAVGLSSGLVSYLALFGILFAVPYYLSAEHISEAWPHPEPGTAELALPVDVVEPMGMETMVYVTVNGTEVCTRVSPASALPPGETMRFTADLRHMHLIDPATDRVVEVPPDCRGDMRLNGGAPKLRVG